MWPTEKLDQIILRFLRVGGPYQAGHLQRELDMIEKRTVRLPELRTILEQFCQTGQACKEIDAAGIVRWNWVKPAPEPEEPKELQKSLF